MQKWLVKVFDGRKPAFNEAFWTKAKACEFMTKAGKNPKWTFELVRLGK